MFSEIKIEKQNPKIFLNVGISGSGKSTFSHELWKEYPNDIFIVSRDVIRQFFGYTDTNISEYYKRDDLYILEDIVTTIQDDLIYNSLNSGISVIVDNTHLKEKYIKDYKKFKVDIGLFIHGDDLTVEESYKRIENRDRKVPLCVIEKQYKDFENLVSNLKLKTNEILLKKLEIKKENIYFVPS